MSDNRRTTRSSMTKGEIMEKPHEVTKQQFDKDWHSTKQMRRFLEVLHKDCPGRLELRVIDPRSSDCRRYWPDSLEDAVKIVIRENGCRANVYCGVATRLNTASGKKENLHTYPGVHVDIDFKDFDKGEDHARQRLDSVPAPTVWVQSGGGWHCYWLLEQPVHITPNLLPSLEGLNRKAADVVGGDHCHSVDHVLRVPGTTNWPDAKKSKAGRIPVPARLLSHDGPRYTLEELRAAFRFRPNDSPSSLVQANDVDEQSLPSRFRTLLQCDAAIKETWNGQRTNLDDTSRSGHDMAMTVRLLPFGFRDGEIKSILKAMPSGRGADTTEQYLTHSITKAREKIQADQASGAVSPSALASDFLRDSALQNDDGLFLRCYRADWLRYGIGAYRPVATADMEAALLSYLQLRATIRPTTRLANDVLMNLRALCHVESSVSLPAMSEQQEWIHMPNVIVVSNGRLDLDHLQEEGAQILRPHSPSFLSVVRLPFPYDPAAPCSRWKTFLKQILPKKASRRLLQEIFGYCLTPDMTFQKFFMFEGAGGNGKSVVLNILTAMLGQDNVSAVPLEVFSAAHGLEQTLGKLTNITGDVGELDKVGEGVLKQFTGQDLIYFNPKYKQPFAAKATAKLIIATNVRPPFRDRSQGVWRRLMLLPFPTTIPERRQNRHLAEELAVELPGILNWAIRGAIRLRKDQQFEEPAESRAAKTEYQREVNPARQFLEEEYEEANMQVTLTDLYDKYTFFCQDNGYKPLNCSHFGREVKAVFPHVIRARVQACDMPRLHPHSSPGRPYVYRGIGPLKD